MGTREQRQRQEELWVATAALARPASHIPAFHLEQRIDSGLPVFKDSAQLAPALISRSENLSEGNGVAGQLSA